MLNDRSFCVMLVTPDGRRALRASTEREVALMAESVLRRFECRTMAVGFSVTGPDKAAGARIAFYLNDVARELETA